MEFLMKKTLLFIFMAIIFLSPTVSRASEGGDTRSAESVARDLLEASGLKKMSAQAAERLVLLRKKAMPDIPEHFWEDFKREVRPKVLDEKIIPIYVKYFSIEEMKSLIAFYRSEIGKKFLSKIPQITKDSMQASREWNMELRQKLTEMLKKADLKKKE